MNNLGVQNAKGHHVLLLNNDTEVINPEWLDEMMSVAQLPEVGAVGPKLLYPDNKIQHAGLVGFGYHIAGHAGLAEPEDANDYYQYYQTTHEVIGVTGACLLVKKSDYIRVDGLEEHFVPNGFGDVDFCLKLKKVGLNNIYVPYAKLYHKESPSRKASFEHFERQYILDKWGHELLNDEYVNPCLQKTPYFREHPHYGTQEISNLHFQSLLHNGSY